jgi:hypothetical protein
MDLARRALDSIARDGIARMELLAIQVVCVNVPAHNNITRHISQTKRCH